MPNGICTALWPKPRPGLQMVKQTTVRFMQVSSFKKPKIQNKIQTEKEEMSRECSSLCNEWRLYFGYNFTTQQNDILLKMRNIKKRHTNSVENFNGFIQKINIDFILCHVTPNN